MVTMHKVLRFISMACLLLSGGLQTAWADSLVASVDRTEITANESLQLSLTASLDVSFSLNFLNLQLPSPDLEPLREDFEIVDQRQRYSFQNINGQNRANITWNYTLMPKRSGTLTIPPLQFRDAQSESIQIRVAEPAAGNRQHEPVFLEAQISKDEVFVQEQLIYTLRLHYLNDILGGELSAPEPTDAIVKQIDKQQEYSRTINGRTYQVIERRYLIIPQKSGNLEIAPQVFSGSFYDGRTRNRQHRQARSEAITVKVMPPQSETGDKPWLPAMSLVLNEEWSRNPDELEVGDSITRTLTIKALGLEGSQLPPLPRHNVPQLRQYPEQPEIDSQTHANGVTGTRTERTAIIAVQGGEVRLPEIQLPWFDTANQEWRTAVIPARVLHIKGAPGSAHQSVDAQGQASALPEPSDTEQGIPSPTLSDHGLPWPWISLALLVLWLTTLATLFIWHRRSPQKPQPDLAVSTQDQEHQAFTQLKALAGQNWQQVRPALLQWSRSFWPRHRIHSLADLMALAQSPALTAHIRQLEASCYSPQGHGSGDTTEVIKAVEQLREAKQQAARPDSGELAELYPALH